MSPPAPNGRRDALFVLASALAACSPRRPPPSPYAHAPLSPGRLAPLPFAAMPSLRADGTLVVERFDDEAARPLGGAYDSPSKAPSATYSFEGAALELSEHFCDALREAGLDARLAYAASPSPEGGDGRARVGGALVAFQHDVIRLGRGPLEFAQAARAVVRLRAGGTRTAPAFAKTFTLEGKAGPGEADLLSRFGRWAAALAAGDPSFLAAVGASPA